MVSKALYIGAGIDTTPHVNQVLGIDDDGEGEGADPEAEARA